MGMGMKMALWFKDARECACSTLTGGREINNFYSISVKWTNENANSGKLFRSPKKSASQKGSKRLRSHVIRFFFALFAFYTLLFLSAWFFLLLPENSLSWKKRDEIGSLYTSAWMRSSALCLCALGILFCFSPSLLLRPPLPLPFGSKQFSHVAVAAAARLFLRFGIIFTWKSHVLLPTPAHTIYFTP